MAGLKTAGFTSTRCRGGGFKTRKLRPLSRLPPLLLVSAHVYCRLQPGQTMDDMSEDLIRDASQLVKVRPPFLTA